MSQVISSGCLSVASLNFASSAEALKAEAGFPTAHQAYVGFVVFCLTLHTWLFGRLHRSDPGWVPSASNGPAAPSSGDHGMPNNCKYCGALAPLRSRHDFKTGVTGTLRCQSLLSVQSQKYVLKDAYPCRTLRGKV